MLLKTPMEECYFTKSNTPPCVLFTFLANATKWHKASQLCLIFSIKLYIGSNKLKDPHQILLFILREFNPLNASVVLIKKPVS